MEVLQQYWWLIAIVVALVLAFILLRPKQRVTLSDSTPQRPHMAYAAQPERRGFPGKAASATSTVAGEIIHAPAGEASEDHSGSRDDLTQIKGVGPKFADALHGLGFHRFEQLASLGETEVQRLDSQLGAFSGRITRDKITDQAAYLARGDIDGFQERFGKL